MPPSIRFGATGSDAAIISDVSMAKTNKNVIHCFIVPPNYDPYVK